MTEPHSTPLPTDRFLGTSIRSDINPAVEFRIERLLGEGGTARAYFALRVAPDGVAPVVIKIILPRIARESGETALLVIRKEAVALGRLNERTPPSPYVVRFIDTGTVPYADGRQVLALPWVALEFVNGGTEGTALDERIAYSLRTTGYAFDPDRAARAVQALAAGLSEIHEVGVVHRDLTPGNVLACGSGDTEMFKISDFGIARPIGLSATFGAIALGTPGYVAPEQAFSGSIPIGRYSDVFALAAVVYFILTGEHYFAARSIVDAHQEVLRPARRSIADARGLCPELRERSAAVQAIDLALARATSADVRARPNEARLFAESLMPWLSDQPRSVRLSTRWLGTVHNLRPSPSRLERTWLLRHPPGDQRLILAAAWNAAGHCLASTPQGLEYFSGSEWTPMPADELLSGRRIHAVERLRPTTWLVGTSGARLVEVGREGSRIISEGPEPSFTFVDFDGDPEDLAVAIAEAPGSPPVLATLIGRRWLKAMPVPQAVMLSGLIRIEDERWLVTGRTLQGRAFVALYSPLQQELSLLASPDARAMLACTARRGRHLALAVGGNGAVVGVEEGRVTQTTLAGQPDLTAIALDATGQAYLASLGRVWLRGDDGGFSCLWQDPTFNVPFVSIHAELGQVVALTVDGGVLEGRAQMMGPTMPA